METYLRLMFLKVRYRLGYESLCQVADSISWQRFARIPLGIRVPHPTTLMKITTRCGDAAVAGLKEALLAKAAAKIARTVERIKAAGGATRTICRDRRRAAGQRARSLGSKLKLRGAEQRDDAQTTVRRITGELADLAEAAARDAAVVLRNARRALRTATGRRKGRLRRALDELTTTVERIAAVVAQTRSRLAGEVPDGATRLVSLHDPDARPTRKGRLSRPVEFGYKAQLVDNADGIILDHTVDVSAPPDAPMLAPRDRADRPAHRPRPTRGHRRPRLRRSRRRNRPARSRRALRRHPAEGETERRPTRCGAPDPKDASAPSKRSYGWNCTRRPASRAPGPGADTALAHTSSRSHPSPPDQPAPRHPNAVSPRTAPTVTSAARFRSQ